MAQELPPDSTRKFYRLNKKIINVNFDEEHIPVDFDKVEMMPFRVDSLFGFVDKNSGEWLIQPKYSQVVAVYTEGAIVKYEDAYGVVKRDGDFLIPSLFDFLYKENNVYHGITINSDTTLRKAYRAFVTNQYYDLNGELLFSEAAHNQQTFSGRDTLAMFRRGTTVTIRTNSGRIVDEIEINKTTHSVRVCDNLLVSVKIEDEKAKYEFHDINGELQFESAITFALLGLAYKISDNFIMIYVGNSAYVFMDSTGIRKPYSIKPVFPYINSPYEIIDSDHFVVTDRKTKKVGVVDRNGEYIIEPVYDFLERYVDGQAVYRDSVNRNFGLINYHGDTIVDSIPGGRQTYYLNRAFGKPFNLYDGAFICSASNFERTHDIGDSVAIFYVDISGKTLLQLPKKYKYAGHFSEGLAPVVDFEGKVGFVDKSGQVVIPLKYELLLAGEWPNQYRAFPEFKNGYAYIKSHKGYIDKTGKEYFSGVIPEKK
jgi:hypothetical protein